MAYSFFLGFLLAMPVVYHIIVEALWRMGAEVVERKKVGAQLVAPLPLFVHTTY
jgi:hypothetical protein